MRRPDLPVFGYLKSRPAGEKRFLLAVPAVGLGTGLVAAGLVHALAWIQTLFWGSPHDLVEPARALSAWHRLLAPVVGGLLVGFGIWWNRGPVPGHGTAGILEAVSRGKGRLSVIQGLKDVALILVTVGSGGSLGREGSLLRGGATIGSWLGQRVGVNAQRLATLVACGAAAGIAAAYNAPIGGAMFAMEVVLGTFALESFGPIVVASALGTLVSRVLIHPYLAYEVPEYPPPVSAWEIGHYALLGILLGLASTLFILALRGAGRLFERSRMPVWVRPVAGFAVVGLIGVQFPEVLGNGYDTVNQLLRGAVPLALVLALPALKMAATAFTRGSGGAGGLFTPTLFVGAVLGSAYGSWCHHAFPNATAPPSAYALAGMGAMLAGTTQAPLTAILMIFELTGEYAVILPLMLACAASMIVCRMLGFESIYTESLSERGLRLGGRMEELVMDRIAVRDAMRSTAPPVHELDPLETVVRRLREEGRKELYVVGDDQRLRGTITLADLSEYLADPGSLATLKARDVVYEDLPLLERESSLSDAIGAWTQVSRDRLPVVDDRRSRRLVGELSAGDIFTLYNQEVLGKEARLAHFVRTDGVERPETTYVELPQEYVVALVRLPDTFAGATIRDLGPRARFGVNVIEVSRRLDGGGEQRIIPIPETELRAGDGLIVVGRPSDIAHLGDPLRLAKLLESKAGGEPV